MNREESYRQNRGFETASPIPMGRRGVQKQKTRDEFGFYFEPIFRELLSRERMRTERTHNPFLLLVVTIQAIAQESLSEPPSKALLRALQVRKLLRKLSEATREIDIKGWYEESISVGIIFPDVDGQDQQRVIEKIQRLVSDAVEGGGIGGIEISTISFPSGDTGDAFTNFNSMLALYPETSMRTHSRSLWAVCKRFVDIAGSLFGIFLFFPIFVMSAIAIKLTSRGPIFYRQVRVGQGGRRFTLLKFRSMFVDSDDTIHREYVRNLIVNSSANSTDTQEKVYKIKGDPRVTTIGRILRKASFDELPQFFNVLLGDMSLVGPRPAIPYEIESYDLWHRRRIIECKPGITGYWQVDGRSSTTFDEMVRMDLDYSRKWSLWFDVALILRTPWAMVTAKGAY